MNLMFPKRVWEPRSESLPDKNGFGEKWDKPKWSSHESTPLDEILREYMQRKYDILFRWKMGWELRKKIKLKALMQALRDARE